MGDSSTSFEMYLFNVLGHVETYTQQTPGKVGADVLSSKVDELSFTQLVCTGASARRRSGRSPAAAGRAARGWMLCGTPRSEQGQGIFKFALPASSDVWKVLEHMHEALHLRTCMPACAHSRHSHLSMRVKLTDRHGALQVLM